jgi:hypothetical protein
VTQKIQKIQKIIKKWYEKSGKKSPLMFNFGHILRIIDEIGVTWPKMNYRAWFLRLYGPCYGPNWDIELEMLIKKSKKWYKKQSKKWYEKYKNNRKIIKKVTQKIQQI